MNKERLLNVAKALRECRNPEKFTMHDVHSCGAPACAIGHYAARRDLQEDFQLPTEDYEDRRGKVGGGEMLLGIWGATKLTGCWSLSVMSHFDITCEQVDELFGYSGCGDAGTPIQAAKYIKRFVDRAP